jgi:hypothetical protein
LVPLPPGLWTTLGPRQQLIDGFEALGVPVPAQP